MLRVNSQKTKRILVGVVAIVLVLAMVAPMVLSA